MLRKLSPVIVCLLVAIGAQAQNFKVQIAAYIESVPSNYFQDFGIDEVETGIDQNQIHRYYVGSYATRDEAERVKQVLIDKGFRYAQIIDMEEQKALCAQPCANAKKAAILVNDLTENLYLKNLFFDFDRSSIRAEGYNDLDKLYTVMSQNPAYTCQVLAHTDSKGSADYNIALSKRRARSVRNYLTKKGLSAARLKTKVFGESDPIAVNESADGSDSPEGRQYNRRVVLVITDASGQLVSDLVAPIDVPSHLKAN